MVPAQAGLIQPVLPGTARGSQTQAQQEQTWPPAGMDGVCLLGGMPSPGACGKQQKRQMAQQSKVQKLLTPGGTAAGSSQLTAGTTAGATGPPGDGFWETDDVS